MNIRWDHPPHNPKEWVTDVAGIGRYHVKRPRKGARYFVAYLNGKSTSLNGDTAEQCMASVARAIRAQELDNAHGNAC